MYCKECGKEIGENEKFCPSCGKPLSEVQIKPQADPPKQNKVRCLPSFILGLIASLFGMFGGLCTTMCSMTSKSGNSAFIMIFCGAILGLIGACLCLSKPKIGSVLEAGSAVLMIIRAYSHSGATFSVVVALLLMSAAALIGIVYSFIIKRK